MPNMVEFLVSYDIIRNMKEVSPESTLETMNRLSFEKYSGLALDRDAKNFAINQVVKALRITQEKLPEIVAGKHGECVVEIRGIGGSFARNLNQN